LRLHNRRIHSSKRPHICPFCRKTFVTKEELRRHERIHTDTKPYSCNHCSERFTRLEQLKTHLLKSNLPIL